LGYAHGQFATSWSNPSKMPLDFILELMSGYLTPIN
jgi:hypothetical protein